MDMGTTTMAMTGMASSTASAAAPTTTDMSMSMGDGCKISMLWNWYTVDSCFLSETWHVTSSGMFAGSCIGVIFLVMALEFLRRSVKEFDRYLIRKHSAFTNNMPTSSASSVENSDARPKRALDGHVAAHPTHHNFVSVAFRPSVIEQAIRALLHMLQFAVAYFIMLLAMYYNGYIIICIFIGAYIGSFIFQWETLGSTVARTSAAQEATVCCG